MHAIYMYVIHKRVGVIVSVTGVCFILKKIDGYYKQDNV